MKSLLPTQIFLQKRRFAPETSLGHPGNRPDARPFAKTSVTYRLDLGEFCGSRSCLGQSGTRRYPDRSSASLYARNCYCSQTAIGMEECSPLAFLLGATVAPSRSMAHHARSQDALLTAVGGENVSTVKKAGERCPVNVRYLRDFRSDLESLGRVLVPVTGDNKSHCLSCPPSAL